MQILLIRKTNAATFSIEYTKESVQIKIYNFLDTLLLAYHKAALKYFFRHLVREFL